MQRRIATFTLDYGKCPAWLFERMTKLGKEMARVIVTEYGSDFFTKSGAWTVVQRGMNTVAQTARRYHWFSENIKDLVCEPHFGISSELRVPTLNLAAQQSQNTRRTP